MSGVEIRSDAQVAITQKCVACDGQGIIGVVSKCRQCGHIYTVADWEAERKADNEAMRSGSEMPDRQFCGCTWHYRADEDEYCAECEGTGTQHLHITLSDLARTLATQMEQSIRLSAITHEYR